MTSFSPISTVVSRVR